MWWIYLSQCSEPEMTHQEDVPLSDPTSNTVANETTQCHLAQTNTSNGTVNVDTKGNAEKSIQNAEPSMLNADDTSNVSADAPQAERTKEEMNGGQCEENDSGDSSKKLVASVIGHDQLSACDNEEGTETVENDISLDQVNETEKSAMDVTLDSTVSDNDYSRSDDLEKENTTRDTPRKSLTPKQLRKKKEGEERRLEKVRERERQKLEKLKQKQEKEEKRNKEKQEKLEQKQKELEQKQKEKELKEEQKRKEREEKDLKKKEKEEKEEQKRKEKELERLKKQQEIEEKTREKMRAEEQKQKAAAAFVNFFVPKKTGNESKDKKCEENQNSLFKDFEVKSDMRLPPERRNPLTNEEKNALIRSISNPSEVLTYLKELRKKKPTGKCGKTWPYEDPLDEVIIIEDETDLGETICEEKEEISKLKAKFLKFHENRRPPYFGTWRKKSCLIKARKPLGQDSQIFNYGEDSDDDWEEEEQGESLDDSDGEEKETETGNDDYEVDNDFFVPHGHLSDDEIDDEATAKLSPESHKQKLKLLKEEFDEDMKSKTNKIKPRFIGCIWYDKEGKNVDEPIDRYLKPLSIITNTIIMLKKRNDQAFNEAQNKKGVSKVSELDPSLVPDFIKLVHGSISKRTALATEFLNFITKSRSEVTVSKTSLSRKIRQIADWVKCPEEGPMFNKFCWYVPEDVRKKYNVNVSLPNQWEMNTKN